MSSPLVVHVDHAPYDTYIGRGRGSVLGNRFSHLNNSMAEVVVATRDESISRFREEAEARIKVDPLYRKAVLECFGRVLGCFCKDPAKPLPCHGDVLVELSQQIYTESFGKVSDVIDRFDGLHKFLSNFAPCKVYLSHGALGIFEYSSVEHAYQAAKTLNMDQRMAIRAAKSAQQAKRMGRRVDLRPDWTPEKRIEVMSKLLDQKFAQEPYRQLLLATGEAALVEGNYWQDKFWGVYYGQGENHLGLLLMEKRDAIREDNRLISG